MASGAVLDGVLHLVIIVFGAFSEGYVMNTLVVAGDAGATGNIALIFFAGSCYLISCFADLLPPAIADLIAPAILLPPLLGELSYGLWLLIKRVDVGRWNAHVHR